MDFQLNLSLLEDLCAEPGISGFEQPVAHFLRNYLQIRGIAANIDRIGNVVAHLPGDGPRAALIAHQDEVGLIVRKIHPNGFLFVERVGGTSPHVLPGKRMLVWTQNGPLPGVVGAVPMHLSSEISQPSLQEMYIDIGIRSQFDVETLGVEVGSPITYSPSFDQIHGCLASKSLDDRLGCFLLLELAERVRLQSAPSDIWLVFVVQEENMLSAGLPVVHTLQPDWALGVDATLAFDTPELTHGQTSLALGRGTVIKVMDRIRGAGQGFISHQGLRQHLEKLALTSGIPFQREVVIGLSTAATPIPFANAGVPTAAISFPLRYSHSAVEVADLEDIHWTADLLEQAVRSPWQG